MPLRTVLPSILVGAFLVGGPAHAARLEVPADNLVISGVNVISGWKCDAMGDITIRFNGGEPVRLVYGSERADTEKLCGDSDNGFVAVWNWGNLEPGSYEAVVYDNGIEFDAATFEVVSSGVRFLENVRGQGTITLSNGQEAHIQWVESLQNFVVIDYTDIPTTPDPTSPPDQLTGAICSTRTGLVVQGNPYGHGCFLSGVDDLPIATSFGGAEDAASFSPLEEGGYSRWNITNPCASWQDYPHALHIDIIPLEDSGFEVDIDYLLIQQGNLLWRYDYGAGGTAFWVNRHTLESLEYTVLPYRLDETPHQTTLVLGQDTGLDLTKPFRLYFFEEFVAAFE